MAPRMKPRVFRLPNFLRPRLEVLEGRRLPSASSPIGSEIFGNVSAIVSPETSSLATTITATSGGGQGTAFNTAFIAPLVATVTDSSHLPVSGVTVTFSAPAAGASARFGGGDTAVTDANGQAHVFAISNGVVGPYSISASAPGISSPATFALTNAGHRLIVTGADTGGGPRVEVFDGVTDIRIAGFYAFNRAFTGGVRVAVGDVNGDGVPDIVAAAGPGGGPHVKVIDGTKLNAVLPDGTIPDSALLAGFYAFSPSFNGGVNVAVGDFLGDGRQEVVTGAGAGGGPQVKVFSIANFTAAQLPGRLGSFYAYSPMFNGGVNVAAGNVDGQPADELITGAGPGGGPHVKVWKSDGSVLASFYAYDPSYTGGVNVAAGDLNEDGRADVVTAPGANSPPLVKVIDSSKLNMLLPNGQIANTALFNQVNAYDSAFFGGVRVAVADVNGDGKLDLLTGAGPSGGPHVKAINAATLAVLDSICADPETFSGGVFVGGA